MGNEMNETESKITIALASTPFLTQLDTLKTTQPGSIPPRLSIHIIQNRTDTPNSHLTNPIPTLNPEPASQP